MDIAKVLLGVLCSSLIYPSKLPLASHMSCQFCKLDYSNEYF